MLRGSPKNNIVHSSLQSLFSLLLCSKINSCMHINYKDLTTNIGISKFIDDLADNTIHLVILYYNFYFHPRNKFWSKLSSSPVNGNRFCLDLPSSFYPVECHSACMCIFHYSVHVVE